MYRDTRRRLLAWTALIGTSAVLTIVLTMTVAHFVGDKPKLPANETSYLARTGHSCLGHIPEVDVEPSEVWRSHWRRLQEEDCKPGSWLYQFREQGQNLAGYQQDQPNIAAIESRLVLIRLGGMESPQHAAVVEPVREFIGLFFQREPVLGQPRELPREAFHADKGRFGQFDAERLLEDLVGTCPDDAAACIAITDRDLFVDRLQYVFGLGHFHKRVGVFSTYRLWEDRHNPLTDRDEPVRAPEPLRRALKVAVHELAHEFSLAHCVHYRHCILGGTNSLAESDAGSLMLCPLDHAKLQWNLGFDPHQRFSDLADFAENHGLHPEARYWRRMAREYPAHGNASAGGN